MRDHRLVGHLSCLIGLALCACGAASDARPNILLLVVDTLRWDHLGCYGYERDTSPAIDALAADAVRFENAYAPAPWTLPTVTSILTGLYPSSHGVTSIGKHLSSDVRSLAELLREEGYGTAAVTSNNLLRQDLHYGRGHDLFEAEPGGHNLMTTPGVTERVLAHLDRLGEGVAPFYLFALLFDPHYSYLPHPEYGFAPKRAGRLDGSQPIQVLRELGETLSAKELQFIRDLYDEEIRYTDEGIGQILAGLEERGLDRNTVVVVVADHGEEFMRHGWIGHSRNLYEDLVHVPLIIRDPAMARRGRSEPRPVSLVSLTPTLLDLAGVDSGETPFQAPSLKGVLRGSDEDAGEPVFCEVDFVPILKQEKRAHMRSVLVDGFKLIRDVETGALELYNLERDPHETRNLAETRVRKVAELEEVLESRSTFAGSRLRAAETTPLSDEDLEMLEGLGYVER